MKWGTFFATAIIIMVIIYLQWPQLKKKPKRDISAFIGLLLIGLFLSMFDLLYIGGPAKWIEHVLKPIAVFMEK
ncbi:hypothetical protein F7731_06545 [Cytobacillus depressus]|uniref:Uncharacterized protein n=1 Tax=Cytobacillus depressus TaxID=1602942 RepID=A0A6L3VC88_9BACI|nr:hypothetical protein [Cytobacillus depressus]KAB2337270.1 hypothetical protein F7731_06545 [Cytobacillus depressus]